MRVISRRVLRDFWERNPDVKQKLKAWLFEAKRAEWKTPHDIKKSYKTASILQNSRVVFNIGGNKYRLVVSIKYDLHTIYIRFIGTHKEYDKINAEEI